MTEDYWRNKARRPQSLENPIILDAFEEKKKKATGRHPKDLYSECLAKSNYIRMWEDSEELGLEDMSMLLCRDKGCDLTYCQATLADPYEQPFADCFEQSAAFNDCMVREQRRYNFQALGVPLRIYIKQRMADMMAEKNLPLVQKNEMKEKELSLKL